MTVTGLGVELDSLKKIEKELKSLRGISISNQCDELNLPLKTVEVQNVDDSIENQAMDYLSEIEDYAHVYFLENRFSFLFPIMCFDVVLEKADDDGKRSFLGSYFYNYLFDENHKEEFIENVRQMDKEKLRGNMELINSVINDPESAWFSIREEEKSVFEKIFMALDQNNLVDATEVYLLENSFYSGWPDLTAVRLSGDTTLRFYEVKGSDSLQLNQMFIFECFREVGFDMRVLQLNE